MRVLLAPVETAGVAGAMRDALRGRGHDADLVVLAPHPYGLPADRVARSYLRRAQEGLLAPRRYDVLHLQFGTSLCEFLDVAWSRVTWRPTVVMHYWGDDCRTRAVAQRLHPARSRVFDAHGRRDDRLTLRRLRLAGRLCAAALVSDLELCSYVAPFFRTVFVVPTPLTVPLPQGPPPAPLPGTGPVVLHAPSDHAFKGTREIVAALQRVAARRPLRPRMVSGVPRSEVLAEIARADLVVDQLNSETSGVFALEAMALGRPVLLEYRRDALAEFARHTPLVPVTAATLEAELERLCDDDAERRRLGAAGAAFVRDVHSADRVAPLLEAVYAEARTSPPGVFEVTASGIRQLPCPPT